jgi:hypothetical protein
MVCFRTDKTQIIVTIAGVVCSVVSATSTQITCTTGPYDSSSITAPVLVYIKNTGFASNVRFKKKI